MIDTDWPTMILHPGDPAVVAAVQRFWLGRARNPLSGRLLRGQLSAAGLTVVDQGSQAMIQDASALGGLITMVANTATDAGAITPPQRDQLLADLAAGAARDDFHFSVTTFAALAVKPGTAPDGDRTGRG